jgi:hypothetical protein
MKNILIILSGSFLLLLFGYSLGKNDGHRLVKLNKTQSFLSSTIQNEIIDIPKEYFDDLQQVWGSDDISAYANQYSPRSKPHKVETKLNYQNLNKAISGNIEEQYSKSGDIAQKRINSIEQFDIDSDGIDETLVLFNEGMNHTPHGIDIYKGNTLIFTIQDLVRAKIIQSKDGNGFYIQTDQVGSEGLCCSKGYNLFRFVWNENKLDPVWEQEVDYLKFS